MDKKTKNTLIISIIGLALVLIGTTFAYFGARITGLESASTISLNAGIMQIQPMKYDLGINIIDNTFKAGELSLSLTGVGASGTKIADIENKSIVGQNRFFKIGTGTFNSANGDTHTYTIKIYFKDTGKNQNYNQGAIFNGKIHVREYGQNIAKAVVNTSNQNHNGKHCYTNDYVEGVTPANGKTYTNGQYSYAYNQYWRLDDELMDDFYWATDASQNGWGVTLTNKNSTTPVTTELCAYINEKPVVNMQYLFFNSLATSIDLSSFDTSNVTNMAFMFQYTKPTSLDLSTFDTSKVTDMYHMFYQSSATNLILSSLDTSNVTNMQGMFANSSATSLDLSSFDTSKVTDMRNMFSSSSATSLNLSTFDTSSVTNMNSMFSSAAATSIDLSSFNTSNVSNMNSMFAETSFTNLDFSSFDTTNLSSFNTSKATSMSRMFANSYPTSLDLSAFDTSRVDSMSYMFNNAHVNSLDLSGFDTSNVSDMCYMFSGTYVTSLDLSNFNTSKVRIMNNMFDNSHVQVLDLSSFDTSRSPNVNNMFSGAETTTGYARTQADADRFNASSNKPAGLTFVVK